MKKVREVGGGSGKKKNKNTGEPGRRKSFEGQIRMR